MTRLLLFAALGMGGMLALLVALGSVVRNLRAAFVTLAGGALIIGVAGVAGVTALKRATGGGGFRIEIGGGGTPPATGPAPTLIPGPGPALLTAERRVAAMGYEVADPGTYHPEGSLHVLVGVAGDGRSAPHHEWAFFFGGGGSLLGEDTPLPSASVLVLGQGTATAALGYPLYGEGDDDCCPSLGRAAVRFRLDRGRSLLRLDPLPAEAARRACCGPGPTPASEPVPRGSRRQ